jgi:hypothetical protein
MSYAQQALLRAVIIVQVAEGQLPVTGVRWMEVYTCCGRVAVWQGLSHTRSKELEASLP